MNFTPGTKVFVHYNTGIMDSFTEELTIRKYENNLLHFEEKSSFYAVECHTASFYGYSYTMAGDVLVTKSKWQIPMAAAAEKVRRAVPSKKAIGKIMTPPAYPLHHLSEI